MSDENPDVPVDDPIEEPAGEAVETGEDTVEMPVEASDESAEATAETVDEAAVEEVPEEPAPRMELSQLKAVIEALIFASPDPLTPRTLYRLLNDEPKEDVLAALKAVQADYVDRGGLHIAEVAGGFQITTRPEYHEWVRRLFHERSANKLSVASLETLSVIAYKQPVTAAEIGEIRSVNTSGVLSTLLERHLIKIVGRKNVIGRLAPPRNS
jgi:segregation and condensation protein B